MHLIFPIAVARPDHRRRRALCPSVIPSIKCVNLATHVAAVRTTPHHTSEQTRRTGHGQRRYPNSQLPTPNSQISNLQSPISNSPRHAPQQHGTPPSRVSTTCRASTPFSPRPVRKKRSEHTKQWHTAHVAGCLKQRSRCRRRKFGWDGLGGIWFVDLLL